MESSFELFDGPELGVSHAPCGGVLEELGQRNCQFGRVIDEPLVEAADPKKCSHFFDIGGCFPLCDGLDLVGLSLDAVCGDGETTEVNPRNGEEAFGLLGVEFFLAEFGEHLR